MNRLQYVQYECIKTDLKEEYDKRINFLHKRIERRQPRQGPYQDAHMVLQLNNIGELNQFDKKEKKEVSLKPAKSAPIRNDKRRTQSSVNDDTKNKKD